MAEKIRLLAAVALLDDLPGARLQRGQVGTVVEELAADVYEVELSDDRGQTYAMLPLQAGQLLPLVFDCPEMPQ